MLQMFWTDVRQSLQSQCKHLAVVWVRAGMVLKTNRKFGIIKALFHSDTWDKLDTLQIQTEGFHVRRFEWVASSLWWHPLWGVLRVHHNWYTSSTLNKPYRMHRNSVFPVMCIYGWACILEFVLCMLNCWVVGGWALGRTVLFFWWKKESHSGGGGDSIAKHMVCTFIM